MLTLGGSLRDSSIGVALCLGWLKWQQKEHLMHFAGSDSEKKTSNQVSKKEGLRLICVIVLRTRGKGRGGTRSRGALEGVPVQLLQKSPAAAKDHVVRRLRMTCRLDICLPLANGFKGKHKYPHLFTIF